MAPADTKSSALERAKRRLASERGSVYLEYALVTCLTYMIAALLLNPDNQLFVGIGYDYSFREFFMKMPLF